MKDLIIAGAGLAGLLAACKFPHAAIADPMEQPTERHRALLRFRDESVSRLTGIQFKRVRVNKGIWFEGEFHQPNIALCNMYSRKAVSCLSNRSIWNIDPVERYIAPDDFYWQLIDRFAHRIHFGAKVDYAVPRVPVINTAPLHIPLFELGIQTDCKFDRAAVTVHRAKIARCDVYQTIYFPSQQYGLYRASITGDTLIAESVNDILTMEELECIIAAFALNPADVSEHITVSQRYGKIMDIPAAERKRLLFALTHRHNIFSVGRFATWRNILLDDVADDLDKVKQLINASEYDLKNFAK